MEIKTLKDLKEFLDTLSEEQLFQRAELSTDNGIYSIQDADVDSFNSVILSSY